MYLFWTKGYEGTSISELTQELGISAPSLYAAFGSKQELFTEAVTKYESDPRSITTAGQGGDSVAGVLEAMFDRAVEEYPNPSHPRGCLVNSDPMLAAEREQNRAITASRLREVAMNSDAALEAETLAAYTHAVLVGLSLYARDGASEQQLQQVARLAVQTVALNARRDDVDELPASPPMNTSKPAG